MSPQYRTSTTRTELQREVSKQPRTTPEPRYKTQDSQSSSGMKPSTRLNWEAGFESWADSAKFPQRVVIAADSHRGLKIGQRHRVRRGCKRVSLRTAFVEHIHYDGGKLISKNLLPARGRMYAIALVGRTAAACG